MTVSTGNVSISNSKIVTKTYNNYINSGSFEILQNPDSSIEAQRKMIPNVYFYMDGDGNGTFKLDASSVVSAYVMSPTASLVQEGTPPSFNVKYDGIDYSSVHFGFIGAAVFKTIDTKNPIACAYVNPSSGASSSSTPSGKGDFTVLYYQCY
jgi:hypothetical protein